MSDGGAVRPHSRDLAPPASSRAVVVGTVRDCAGRIGTEVARMGKALSGFRRIQWLLVESDSEDGTPSSLEALARSREDFHFIRLGQLRDRLPARTARIAFCRNAYLEALRSDERYSGVDFVVVADFDGVNSLLTDSAIASCWRRDDWDACAANQRGRYYDIWALRHPEWSPNDCWMQYRFLTETGLSPAKAWSACVHSRMVRISADAPWIEVDSAFGGLAVYRRDPLVRCEYVGITSEGQELCEHVGLHAALRAHGGRIFINPALINGDSLDHTDGRLIQQRMTRMLGRIVARVTA
jgi:hypothetical protein